MEEGAPLANGPREGNVGNRTDQPRGHERVVLRSCSGHSGLEGRDGRGCLWWVVVVAAAAAAVVVDVDVDSCQQELCIVESAGREGVGKWYAENAEGADAGECHGSMVCGTLRRIVDGRAGREL